MTASLVRRDSQAQAGGTVTYSIWVWSTVNSRQVTAAVSRSGQAIDEPKFALCPADHAATCSIGSLVPYQALELLVTDHIGKTATSGRFDRAQPSQFLADRPAAWHWLFPDLGSRTARNHGHPRQHHELAPCCDPERDDSHR